MHLISAWQEKPAFIRTDREAFRILYEIPIPTVSDFSGDECGVAVLFWLMQAKIAQIFEAIGLDGAKMESFDNPGPLETFLQVFVARALNIPKVPTRSTRMI